MSIPFIDLKAQFSAHEDEIRAAIDAVLAHGKYIMGPEVGKLESELAAFAGVKYVVTCSNGTDALLMPLMAWDIGPGDAVFTTPFTFIATAEVIALLGAKPVFVDIDPNTFNIDPEQLEAAIVREQEAGAFAPKVIIPVDLFGLLAPYDEIAVIAEKYGLRVLEDAAQSFGASHQGKMAGAFGDAAATSFFPAKPLGCYGDGGAVLTNDDQLAGVLKSIRVHGKGGDKYDNIRIGLNARLDTIQAAILRVKLKYFAVEIEKRQQAAEYYSERLKDAVNVPYVPECSKSAWAQYSILSEQRNHIQMALKKTGLPSAVYYPKPLHLQTAFAYLEYSEGDLPISESIPRKILSLPMHPYLEKDAQKIIIESILSAV